MVQGSRGDLVFRQADRAEVGNGVKRLLGCYPAGKPADPQVYVAAVTAVLAQYPNEVVRQVTDPINGLPASCKFLPSIAELTEACSKLMAPYRAEYREAMEAAKRAAEREDREKYNDPEMRKRVNAMIEDWKAGRPIKGATP